MFVYYRVDIGNTSCFGRPSIFDTNVVVSFCSPATKSNVQQPVFNGVWFLAPQSTLPPRFLSMYIHMYGAHRLSHSQPDSWASMFFPASGRQLRVLWPHPKWVYWCSHCNYPVPKALIAGTFHLS